MCEGIDEHALGYMCDRADIAGVPFACKHIQRRAKAKSCTAMVSCGDGTVAVGQIRSFIRFMPPWAELAADCLEIADVQWYGDKGSNEQLFGAPQVTKAFKSDPNGNLCLVQELIPMHVCWVPHLQHKDWWQVLFLQPLL